MQLLQRHTWMVEVIENQPDNGWCYLKDYGDQPEAAIEKAAKHQLLEIITELQKIPVTATDLNFEFGAIWSTYEQIVSDNQDNPLKQQACIALSNELNETKRLQQQLPTTPKVLGHQDLHLGNLTLDGTQLILLDWEYAGICQPWLDAAGLISKFSYTPAEVNQLPAFQHLNSQSFATAIDIAQRFNNQLEVLWLQAREISDTGKQ